MGIAPKVDTWFVYTDGLHEGQEPFLDWITNMSSNPDAPFVHSISYGDEESSISLDYAIRVDIEFQVPPSPNRTHFSSLFSPSFISSP